MDNWVWALMTVIFTFYFLKLLLEFNRPGQRLMAAIEAREKTVKKWEERVAKAKERYVATEQRIKALEAEKAYLEDRYRQLRPQANARRFIKIPEGYFQMGSREEDSPSNERPLHLVFLPSYYISPFPVTNLDYFEFVNCTGYPAPLHWRQGSYPPGTSRHPVVNVSWNDAAAYADWIGARLPTEAEWEKAARGTDGRLYPWGGRFSEDNCNALNPAGHVKAVDEYPAGRSVYGLWDTSGNVYEWCSDFYHEHYYKESPSDNPRGPEGGYERTIRGGSYMDNRPAMRTTHRLGAGEHVARETIGFRVAMSDPRARQAETQTVPAAVSNHAAAIAPAS